MAPRSARRRRPRLPGGGDQPPAIVEAARRSGIACSFRHEAGPAGGGGGDPARTAGASLHRRALELLAQPQQWSSSGSGAPRPRPRRRRSATRELVLEFAPARGPRRHRGPGSPPRGRRRTSAGRFAFADRACPPSGEAQVSSPPPRRSSSSPVQFAAADRSSSATRSVCCGGAGGLAERARAALATLLRCSSAGRSGTRAEGGPDRRPAGARPACRRAVPGPELVDALLRRCHGCFGSPPRITAAADWTSARRARGRPAEADRRSRECRLVALRCRSAGWRSVHGRARRPREARPEPSNAAKAADAAGCGRARPPPSYVIVARTACRRRDYADRRARHLTRRHRATAPRATSTSGVTTCSAGGPGSARPHGRLVRGRAAERAHLPRRAVPVRADPRADRARHAYALGAAIRTRGARWTKRCALAEPRNELQWMAPVAIARAEAAWLEEVAARTPSRSPRSAFPRPERGRHVVRPRD